MSNSIKPENLGNVISEKLKIYENDIQKSIDKCGAKAVKELVRITKDTAPFNAKHYGKHYVDCIDSKKQTSRITESTYIWYVKAPCYRLTHLLVNGHVTKDGNRTKKDLFLKNACDKVLPEYEKDVIKAVQGNGD